MPNEPTARPGARSSASTLAQAQAQQEAAAARNGQAPAPTLNHPAPVEDPFPAGEDFTSEANVDLSELDEERKQLLRNALEVYKANVLVRLDQLKDGVASLLNPAKPNPEAVQACKNTLVRIESMLQAVAPPPPAKA